jgi:diguanylate cyclase (GGDEF)-like protein
MLMLAVCFGLETRGGMNLSGQFLACLTTRHNFCRELTGNKTFAIWSRTTLKPLMLPGGVLLLSIAVLVHSGWLTLPLPALSFLYYCALAGGILLAWRFHSTRTFFALLLLFLAHQAIALFGAEHCALGTAGWTVLQAVAVLVPLNFVVIALTAERGITISGTAPIGLCLFVQVVVVAVLCRAGERAPSLPSHAHYAATAISMPTYVWWTLATTGIFLLVRFLFTRKPVESALLWSLAAFSLSLYFVATVRISTAYWAAAACVLAVSIVENSYLLAYHDELTMLPSRRAFNEALLRLQPPYSIAVADIDHFKRFNDTYGHDAGDQVLRLVAAQLASVSGGGHAYRCGGEEFAILFPGQTVSKVVDHLEHLRAKIETDEFRLRGDDRRRLVRGPDRRNGSVRRRVRTGHAIRQLAQGKSPAPLSVTVSIGVAASTAEKPHPDLVLQAADMALYRAKANGRNRVETVSDTRRRSRLKAAGMA